LPPIAGVFGARAPAMLAGGPATTTACAYVMAMEKKKRATQAPIAVSSARVAMLRFMRTGNCSERATVLACVRVCVYTVRKIEDARCTANGGVTHSLRCDCTVKHQMLVREKHIDRDKPVSPT